MKTTQGKAISAFTVLAQMSRRPMSGPTAYKLFKLKKALAPIVEFQTEQEYKLVEELGGSVNENGAVCLDKKGVWKYREKHKELEELECEVETGCVDMHMTEVPEISVFEMDALDGFVNWKEDDNNGEYTES